MTALLTDGCRLGRAFIGSEHGHALPAEICYFVSSIEPNFLEAERGIQDNAHGAIVKRWAARIPKLEAAIGKKVQMLQPHHRNQFLRRLPPLVPIAFPVQFEE